MSENEIKPVAWVDLDVWISTNDAGDSFFTDCQDEDTVAVYDQSAIDRLTAERDAAVAALDRIVSLKMSMFKDTYDMLGECVNIAADAIDAARSEGE